MRKGVSCIQQSWAVIKMITPKIPPRERGKLLGWILAVDHQSPGKNRGWFFRRRSDLCLSSVDTIKMARVVTVGLVDENAGTDVSGSAKGMGDRWTSSVGPEKIARIASRRYGSNLVQARVGDRDDSQGFIWAIRRLNRAVKDDENRAVR